MQGTHIRYVRVFYVNFMEILQVQSPNILNIDIITDERFLDLGRKFIEITPCKFVISQNSRCFSVVLHAEFDRQNTLRIMVDIEFYYPLQYVSTKL
jgi:hypothetical protein